MIIETLQNNLLCQGLKIMINLIKIGDDWAIVY
jgi:hypothetical protein